MIYTIERLKCKEDFTEDVKKFWNEEAPKIGKLFDDKLDYRNCKPILLAERGVFFICRRDGEITGQHISSLSLCPLDLGKTLLHQMHFYAKPDSGRTAYHLFKEFLDFGKLNADHIITMLTSQTNIKSSTLERMGFEELETLYRLEV